MVNTRKQGIPPFPDLERFISKDDLSGRDAEILNRIEEHRIEEGHKRGYRWEISISKEWSRRFIDLKREV